MIITVMIAAAMMESPLSISMIKITMTPAVMMLMMMHMTIKTMMDV